MFCGRRNDHRLAEALGDIASALWGIARAIQKQGEADILSVSFGRATQKEGSAMATSISITNQQKISVTFTPDATIDGAIELVVESGDGTFTRIDDFSFYLVSPSTSGVAITQYLASADADRGAGIVRLEHAIVMTTDDPQATTITPTFGAPEPK
jgi:hypothetical protein